MDEVDQKIFQCIPPSYPPILGRIVSQPQALCWLHLLTLLTLLAPSAELLTSYCSLLISTISRRATSH